MTPHFQFYRNNRIKYYKAGAGDPLLLVHGYQADSRMWKELVSLLEDRYMLIIPDLPGHGGSPLIQVNNTMDFLAEILFSITMSTGAKAVSIAGHSMGGYVALAFADKYPGLTEKLILINSHPFEDSITRTLARNREADLILKGRKEILLSNFVRNNFSGANRYTHTKEIDLATKMALEQPESGMLADLTGMMTRTEKASLALSSRFNVEFILGTDDTRIPLKEIENIDKDKVKMHWLNNCGHMCPLEKPREVAAIIKRGS
jgi:pimeloyl-ACP methyl ester carboxylesterase